MLNPANMDQKAQEMLLSLEETQKTAIDHYELAKVKLEDAKANLAYRAGNVAEAAIELRKFIHAHGG